MPQRLQNPTAGCTAISVALCTRNGALFIREQVRSICLQTLPPREIVLSDDASSDDTVAIARRTVEECATERPQRPIALRVLENAEALRVTKNFEQAVRACRHELIALSDQDDVWHPDRLARAAVEFQRRADLILLHGDARLVDGARQDLGVSLLQTLEATRDELASIHAGRAFDVLLRRNLATGATTAFRRSLLDVALPFPSEWLHDEWLAIIASAVGRVDVLEAALIEYRQHGRNQIGAGRMGWTGKLRKAISSRGDSHARRALKAKILLARLGSLGGKVDAATMEKCQLKLAHEEFRAALPSRRIARCLPVLREASKGNYSRFGYGAQGMLRDLLEAA
jgi:glycosyltransferase involved in cell wall biosynthesis